MNEINRDRYKDLDDRIGHTMRAIRLQKGLQAQTVVDRIGKSKDWLYRLERGGSWSLYNYMTVCNALDMGSADITRLLNELIEAHHLQRAYPPLYPANP
ncbi:MAG: hypothetical protein CMM76_17545 [Rhodospirillaceae bacterium]|nr:hypothetical protein [Rhodospirillaceae bacterium]MBE91235.1 hypothetical protein [Rhodospirillaceae bacterium]